MLPLILGLMLPLELVALLSLKVGLLGLMLLLLLGLLLKTAQLTLSQRARQRCSAIQISEGCAHSLSFSINGIAGESNETKIKIVRLLQAPRRLFSRDGYFNSRHQSTNSAVLSVNLAL